MISAIKSAGFFHASLHFLRAAVWKAPGNMRGCRARVCHSQPRAVLPCHLSPPPPRQLPAWPSASQPPTGPAFLTNITHDTGFHLPQKLPWKALPAPQADTGHPTGTPCNARDTLPCLSQPSTKAQQKPAARSPHRCLADLQLKKSLHSPLHFSSTLCQPSRGSGYCLGDGVLINQKL